MATRDPKPRNLESEARLGTRAQLLETAGELFAERGFDAVTGREICLKAGANSAAINYHFGGMDGLYEAVLVRARDSFLTQESVVEAMSGSGSIEDRMRRLAGLGLRSLFEKGPALWGLRLLSRELTSPSRTGQSFLVAMVRQRMALFRAIIVGLTGLPEDHPAVGRCCLSLAGPLQILLIADHEVLGRLYPGLELTVEGVDALVEHFIHFSVGGLQAVAAAERAKALESKAE